MGSITIPTTELIGCINDVLPTVLNPKAELYGLAIEWQPITVTTEGLTVETREMSLRFTAYDVQAGATVEWVPGEGAEGQINEGDEDNFDEPNWGGDADPFRVFVRGDHAKDIIKVFKLPAKLWRFPVTLKVNPSQSKLIIEREDGPTAERLLTVPTANDLLRHIPDVHAIATALDVTPAWMQGDGDGNFSPFILNYSNARFAALGAVRFHGITRIYPNAIDEPTQIRMGTRYHAFLYREGAKVQRFNLLRDGVGVLASREIDEEPVPDVF